MIRKILLASVAILSLPGGLEATQQLADPWRTSYKITESGIIAPTFRKAVYDITDFGAKAGNGKDLNTEYINSAIKKCSGEGGGTVLVPAGVWLTGPVVLKSNVNLKVDEGAVLLFTADTAQYPKVLTRWEGMDCYNVSPMIYAYGETNIAITGKGVIDGGATRENWWGLPRLSAEPGKSLRGRPLLMDWNEKGVAVENRRMFANDNLRPQLINLYKCKNILVSDLTLNRPAFWTIHPLLCENITVRGVTINTQGAPNGDGCDPESCKNVLIENCFFNTGDDCIAIKSGRNGDGRIWNTPSENIIVRNCKMKNGHGGVVIGSEISGGYRNLFVENCEMDSPSLDRVIRIKTNNCRGGVVENIYVRNVKVGQCKEAVLLIDLTYEPNENCRRDFPPFVKNVFLDNVTCQQSRYGAFLTGFTEQTNISGVYISNCEWNNVKEGNRIRGSVGDLKYENTKINGELVKQ
jgi:polygalacturonase